MVKLKDIAARAGVSIMTVSKALRDKKDISAEMRVRIHQIAAEMMSPKSFDLPLRMSCAERSGT